MIERRRKIKLKSNPKEVQDGTGTKYDTEGLELQISNNLRKGWLTCYAICVSKT